MARRPSGDFRRPSRAGPVLAATARAHLPDAGSDSAAAAAVGRKPPPCSYRTPGEGSDDKTAKLKFRSRHASLLHHALVTLSQATLARAASRISDRPARSCALFEPTLGCLDRPGKIHRTTRFATAPGGR